MKRNLQLIVSLITSFLIAIPVLVQGQNALSFDGSNDYVQTTYAGVFANNDRTFEAWIKLSASATGNNCILDYGTNTASSRNTFIISGNKQLSYIAGGTNTNFGTANNAITPGVWTHVAMVMQSGSGTMYVNGVAMGTGSLTGVNTPSGNSDLRIGQRVSGGSIPFMGEIEEVRVWNVARSAAEIQATMNSEFCVAPASLQAYYKFNQGTDNSDNSSAWADGWGTSAANNGGSATTTITYSVNEANLTGTVTGNNVSYNFDNQATISSNNSITDSFNGAAGVNQNSQNLGHNALTQQQVSFQGNVNNP